MYFPSGVVNVGRWWRFEGVVGVGSAAVVDELEFVELRLWGCDCGGVSDVLGMDDDDDDPVVSAVVDRDLEFGMLDMVGMHY